MTRPGVVSTIEQRQLVDSILQVADERERLTLEHGRLLLAAHASGVSVRYLAESIGERPGTVYSWLERARREQADRIE